jgi:hypothetical protein
MSDARLGCTARPPAYVLVCLPFIQIQIPATHRLALQLSAALQEKHELHLRCGELTKEVLRKEGELAQAKASLEQAIRVRGADACFG